jgi:carbon-monoxide dehydrogenase small subunit
MDARTQKPARQVVELEVDGETIEATIAPHRLLVDVLRDACGRTSVKEGCESASCGACTVLVDDVPRLACITPAADVIGSKIRTAESLRSSDGRLHALQEAFIHHHAVQCGFCTPGMLMAGLALLEENSRPTEQEVRDAIAGNLCRCTGYVRIVRAILAAAQTLGARSERRLPEMAS